MHIPRSIYLRMAPDGKGILRLYGHGWWYNGEVETHRCCCTRHLAVQKLSGGHLGHGDAGTLEVQEATGFPGAVTSAGESVRKPRLPHSAFRCGRAKAANSMPIHQLVPDDVNEQERRLRHVCCLP